MTRGGGGASAPSPPRLGADAADSECAKDTTPRAQQQQHQQQHQQQQWCKGANSAHPGRRAPTRSSSQGCSQGSADAVIAVTGGSLCSIYDLYSSRRVWVMLLVTALCTALMPLADTIIVPGLPAMQRDLGTSESTASFVVSGYILAVGLGAPFWGAASDRFGRKRVLASSLVAFVLLSLGCFFAPTIGLLLPLRVLQGVAVAAGGPVASGVLADTVAPTRRGTAAGVANLPMFIGPILAPTLGGALAQLSGWRSTFIAVAAGAAVVLVLLVLSVPETHQYRALSALKIRDAAAAAAMKEAADIEAHPPAFKPPWYAFATLCQPALVLHVVGVLASFGSMFTCVVLVSVYLAKAPYNLSPGMIGVAMLAQNAAGVVFMPLGGRLSDVGAALDPAVPQLRLLWNTITNLVCMPLALLGFGLSLNFAIPMAVPLCSLFLVGAAVSLYLPGAFALLTVTHQAHASAVCSGLHSFMFLACGVLLLAGTELAVRLGTWQLFVILAAINLVVCAAALAHILVARRRAACAGASGGGEARCKDVEGPS